jgi:hypothetical protein
VVQLILPGSRAARRRTVVLTVIVVLMSVSALPVPRTWVLRQAGSMLVAEDALAPADMIVLTVDAAGPGVVEAIDLVAAGWATRVALFVEAPSRYEQELSRRGIAFEDSAARTTSDLRAAGISQVHRIAETVDGTEEQGPVLAEWCATHGIDSVIVVGTSDHTRRLRRVLRRSMRDRATRVMVRAARFSEYDPDRWWQTRSGIRIQIGETQKLLLDFLRHPVG